MAASPGSTTHAARIAGLVASIIRPEIQALSSYHVPDAHGLIKLDAMENPYPWPPDAVDAWLERLRDASISRYPDGSARELRSQLRSSLSLPAQVDLLLGNGSDELIQLIALCVATPGRALMAPEPGFVMYRAIASLAGMHYVGVPLHRDDFSLDLAAMREAMHRHNPAVIFLACPNNPTGNQYSPNVVHEIVEHAPGLVVVDEAYAPFSDITYLGDIPRFENLLVMRTLSKMGLAGLRLGLLAGEQAWLEQFDKARLPYNINTLSQISARFALQHAEIFAQQAQRIRTDREALFEALSNRPGIVVYPSHANFILFRLPEGQADRVFEGLRAEGVLVKNLHGSNPMLSECLRVTVGQPEENATFLTALDRSLPG